MKTDLSVLKLMLKKTIRPGHLSENSDDAMSLPQFILMSCITVRLLVCFTAVDMTYLAAGYEVVLGQSQLGQPYVPARLPC